MTRCPKTGQVIFTKMESSPKWFETYKLNDNTVRCPNCGDWHMWSKKDAWLEDK